MCTRPPWVAREVSVVCSLRVAGYEKCCTSGCGHHRSRIAGVPSTCVCECGVMFLLEHKQPDGLHAAVSLHTYTFTSSDCVHWLHIPELQTFSCVLRHRHPPMLHHLYCACVKKFVTRVISCARATLE